MMMLTGWCHHINTHKVLNPKVHLYYKIWNNSIFYEAWPNYFVGCFWMDANGKFGCNISWPLCFSHAVMQVWNNIIKTKWFFFFLSRWTFPLYIWALFKTPQLNMSHALKDYYICNIVQKLQTVFADPILNRNSCLYCQYTIIYVKLHICAKVC